jgi:predicted RNA-binding protein YlxR (DUF448 family)
VAIKVQDTTGEPSAGALQSRSGRGAPVVRTCIVSRRELPQDALIRFVVGPDGVVFPDITGRLPGRGVYIAAQHDLVADAVKRSAFARAFKRAVVVAPDLVTEVERLLALQARQALSLAKKAGLVTTGFAKVDADVAAGRAAALVHALDGRPDGIGKLDRKFRAVQLDRGQAVRIVALFTSDELSLAIGRENVVHAALARGGQTKSFLRCCARLQSYRTAQGQDLQAEALDGLDASIRRVDGD